MERKKLIANIRILCAEMIEKAKSGHPGSALALSPVLFDLYQVLDLHSADRDIFLLSNAHVCVVQYVMNHLIGLLELEDLKSFRQLNSNCPGHPEQDELRGIEITSEPLGQGVAQAVGFAIALKKLGSNKRVVCILGDGCYQEGISQEAFSLAAHLGLDNLIYIYDSNEMTIDGNTSLSMTEDRCKRFEALGFDVKVATLTDEEPEYINFVMKAGNSVPRILILKTTIGQGCSLAGLNRMHGLPVGREVIEKMKSEVGIKGDFFVSDEFRDIFPQNVRQPRNYLSAISQRFEAPNDYVPEKDSVATRKHLMNAINDLDINERFISGSADLADSIGTKGSKFTVLDRNNFSGNFIHYGIREHAMCAIMNGLSVMGFIPISGTFLNFVLYCFPAIRTACIDNLHNIYVLTHDSVRLGEDGPTHQPIESLALLRATPNLHVLRPCDGVETRFSLVYALNRNGPTCLILSRQNIPLVLNTSYEGCSKGAYLLKEVESPQVTIIASGSEVPLAIETAENLLKRGIPTNVLSFLSFEIFEELEYSLKKESFKGKIVSLEILSTFGWSKYADLCIGIDSFGKSGTEKDILNYFGFTVEGITAKICHFLETK